MSLSSLNDVLVGTLSPNPGSELFKKIKEEGKTIMDDKYFEDLVAQGSIDVMSCDSNYHSKTELYIKWNDIPCFIKRLFFFKFVVFVFFPRIL